MKYFDMCSSPSICSELHKCRHSKEQTERPSDDAACYANLGVEILALLRSKADAPWEYYNPHFLLAITEQIEAYYKAEDDVVDNWVQEMFSA